jgi:uncharacterized protein (DUF2236 family)
MRSTIARDLAWRGFRLGGDGMPGVFHECELNASGRSLYRMCMPAYANRVPSSAPADAATEAPHAGAPLDSNSLTWRYLADLRGLLLVLRAGVLQVMHPSISAALVDHSDVFENPLGRLIRSAGPILGAVYDEDADTTARWIRERHPSIRGRDPDGHRYHALDPGTYYWAHATFFEAQIATQELFGVPFTTAEKQQLYAESITWYARYGLTMRPVPPDYDAFERYWQQMLEDVLEATPIALEAVQTMSQLPAPYPRIDGPAWATVRPLIGFSAPWLARGTLPLKARETLAINWSLADELTLRTLRTLIRTAWPILPSSLRHLPRARRVRQ